MFFVVLAYGTCQVENKMTLPISIFSVI